MSLSDFDRQHIEEIMSKGLGTWFSAELIRLIAKADTQNRERIRQAFPDHVAAYEDWYYRRGAYKGAGSHEVAT